ncbi:MFS transporter [uncultured Schumannella sp.]|uniref:MFS transporter n=1 Tax=uncultured Schumannella sp. TaxID=1195956 RepID=UPI0025D76CA7|nr:MFS transporter [uncultured Schumannella sp.]
MRGLTAASYLAASVPLRLATSGVMVALPILAATELGDLALGGQLVAATLGPSVLAAPLVGVTLDRTRHPRRWMLAGAGVTAAAFALAASLGSVPTPLVMLALVASGMFAPFFMGGLSSFVADEFVDARRGYAHDALSYNVGSVGGPALVAVLAVAGSPRTALLVLAAIGLLGCAGLFALRLAPRPAPRVGAVRTMATGMRHLVAHRPIAIVTLSGTLSQLGAGGLAVAAVAVALERAGSAERAAWVVTAFAIGGLLGALAVAARRWGSAPPIVVMGAGFAATGVATVVAAIDLGFVWTVAAIGVSGLFTASSAAAMLLLRKEQSPLAVRSQVFTVGAGLRASAAAAGAAIAGAMAHASGGVLLATIGGVWVISALVLLAYPRNAVPLATGPIPTGAASSS